MQSQVAIWEHNEQVLCPLLASSPPLTSDLTSQTTFKFFSLAPQSSTFNPFGSFSSVTPPNTFVTSTAAIFDTQIDQQLYANSIINGTISSNSNPNSAQQFAANSLATTNANLTEYIKSLAALNGNSTDINTVLAVFQPASSSTNQLLTTADGINAATLFSANNPNSQNGVIAANQSIDPSSTKNSFVQSSLAAALLNNSGGQQTTSSVQPTTRANTLSELNSFLSNSLLQQSQQPANLANQSNPFLGTSNKQGGTSAFKLVESPKNNAVDLLQQQQAVLTGEPSNLSLCSSKLTEALEMLRSPIRDLPVANRKPIPLNSPIDLASFRVKDPYKWNSDDVVAWVLDVARKHNIPREEIGVIEFGSQNGNTLARLTEDDFKQINSSFGALMYLEFRRLLKEESSNAFDNLMRYCKNDETGEKLVSTSHENAVQQAFNNSVNLLNSTLSPGVSSTFGRFLSANSSMSPLVQQSHVANVLQLQQQDANLQQFFQNSQDMYAQQRKQLNDLQQQQMLRAQQFIQNNSPSQNAHEMPGPSSAYDHTGAIKTYGKGDDKISKNKDGRPRKRSQHTKGNKLWEFIRDALKDPTTCPTIVRWEDPDEGVFRIVESEKLARLWGEKKNNQKMTYEKLSRAMRTYYEKQILVPVPKTGLYPKKLVYKFGPGAHGWSAPPHLARACLKLPKYEELP